MIRQDWNYQLKGNQQNSMTFWSCIELLTARRTMASKKLKKILFSMLKVSLSLCWARCDWNFDNEKEKPVVTKKKLSIEDFISFCIGSRYIIHNLMRAGTMNFRHFEWDTLTFPVNDRYNSEPEQFLKNIVDDIYCSPCFGKC